MRFFLSKVFNESVSSLSQSVQTLVWQFQKEILDSANIPKTVEKLVRRKTYTIHKQCIDEDFILLLALFPEKKCCLFLQVSVAEKALEWSKSHNVIWNDQINAFQTVSYTDSKKSLYPLPVSSQVPDRVLTPLSVDDLRKIGVPDEAIDAVRNLPSRMALEAMESLLPAQTYQYLVSLFDGVGIRELVQTVEDGSVLNGDDALSSYNMRSTWVEVTSVEDLTRLWHTEAWKLFLHPLQRRLVERENKGSMRVSGGAGTGKTVTTLLRGLRLAQREQAHVLYLTYTATTCEHVRTLASEFNLPQAQFTVETIDNVLIQQAMQCHLIDDEHAVDLKADMSRSYQLWQEVVNDSLCEFDPEFLCGEYHDVIVYFDNKTIEDYLRQSRAGRKKVVSRKQRMEIWHLKEEYERRKKKLYFHDRFELFNLLAGYMKQYNRHPYNHILVDEFQDFSNPELRLVRALVAEGSNDLFLVGDPFQRIYNGRMLNFSAVGIRVRGACSKRLKIDYQHTEEIRRVAVGVVAGVACDDLDGGEEIHKGYVAERHGSKPTYQLVEDEAEMCKVAKDFIAGCVKAGIEPETIAVTYHDESSLTALQSALSQQGIAAYQWDRGYFKGNVTGVRYCPLEAMKGRAFRAVVVLGVNERHFPATLSVEPVENETDNIDKQMYLRRMRAYLYVAITRASDQVLCIGEGLPTSLIRKV